MSFVGKYVVFDNEQHEGRVIKERVLSRGRHGGGLRIRGFGGWGSTADVGGLMLYIQEVQTGQIYERYAYNVRIAPQNDETKPAIARQQSRSVVDDAFDELLGELEQDADGRWV